MIFSQHKFENSFKVNSSYLCSNKFTEISENIYYYIDGEIFNDYDTSTIISDIANKRFVNLKKLIGEFSIYIYDKSSNQLSILNDKTGRNIVYYTNKSFVSISEDFWDIVYHNKFTIEDVDIHSLKEHIFLYLSLEHKTILKDLNIVKNATLTTFDKEEITSEKYWYFEQCENNFTKDEKFDLLENSYIKTLEKIEDLNSSNEFYGIGVSGGMDSRLIPYYSQKVGLKLQGFIIGKEKPNLLLKSNDHLLSDILVDFFKIPHKKVDFDRLTYYEKNRLDAINFPIGNSQVFKISKLDELNFDVLLTGASGFIVGASPFYSTIKKESIESIVFNKQSSLKLRKRFVRLFKSFNFLLGKPVFDTKDNIQNSLNGVLKKSDVSSMKNNLSNILDDMKDLSKTEQLMNYAVGYLGQRNKGGSFESLLNRKKNYSLYTTYTLEMMKYLTDDEIYDRKLFEDFIKERIPELAQIKGQDHKTAIGNKAPSFVQKFFSIFLFTIRGQGVMNYHNWVNSRKFKSFYKQSLKEKPYITKYFDLSSVIKYTETKQLNSIILTNIVKFNEIISLIDTINEEYPKIKKQLNHK